MEKRQETGVGDPTRAGLLRHYGFFFFFLFSYDFYLLAISNFYSNSLIIFFYSSSRQSYTEQKWISPRFPAGMAIIRVIIVALLLFCAERADMIPLSLINLRLFRLGLAKEWTNWYYKLFYLFLFFFCNDASLSPG